MSRQRRRVPLLRLAWRNTRRNTRRTALTVSAAAVAVMVLTYGLSHITGIMNGFVETYARLESGHVRIRKAGYSDRERFLPVHMNVRGLSQLLPAIRARADVEEAVPRVRASVLVDGAASNRPGLLLGVDLTREEPYLAPVGMTSEGRPPRAGHAEALVGKAFAEKLEVGVGDTLTLLGQTAYRSLGGLRLTITGLAVSGVAYLDGMMVVAPLDQAQALTDLPDAATEILVFGVDHRQVELMAAGLSEELDPAMADGLEILSWKEQGELGRLVDTVRPMLGVLFFIFLLMACLIIVNTMLMTVMERTQEFGMQAALGMRRSDIVRLILMEGLTIGVIGALAGGVLGTGVAVWLENVGINLEAAARGIDLPFQGVVYPDWRVSFVLSSAMLGVITAAVATIYPAWRAIRRTPAEALRA